MSKHITRSTLMTLTDDQRSRLRIAVYSYISQAGITTEEFAKQSSMSNWYINNLLNTDMRNPHSGKPFNISAESFSGIAFAMNLSSNELLTLISMSLSSNELSMLMN